MTWTETYQCDVCGVSKNEDDPDWWLASSDAISPVANAPEQQEMRFTPWNGLLSHGPGVRHLCGARCAQTELDRWMTPIREALRSTGEPVAAAQDQKTASGA